MTKKRKASSPTQAAEDVSSDTCEELKALIVSETAKCVKEIKDFKESIGRRLRAVEVAVDFAMDSTTAASNRQKAADASIVELQKETAELKRRLLQFELNDDHLQQQKRLNSLIFSGPALQAESRREAAANLIESLIRQYIKHALDRAQVKNLIRLRNGKVIFEFTSSAPGSDRDIVYRSRAKLKGSGLFVAESLTPRRQAIFADLLRLKKQGRIFAVFTRSGDILACRSRDAVPVRIADPEAVRRLAGPDAGRRPEQGRAQAADRAALPAPPAAGAEAPGRAREDAPALPTLPAPGESTRAEDDGPTVTSGPVQRVSSDPRRRRAMDDSEPAGPRDTHQLETSLLECARESPVRLVHLSPPLLGGVASGGVAGLSARCVVSRDSTTNVAPGASVSPVGRPAAASSPPLGGDLESPMTVTSADGSPRLRAAGRGDGEPSGRRPSAVSGSGATVLPPSERAASPVGPRSVVGGAGSGIGSPLGGSTDVPQRSVNGGLPPAVSSREGGTRDMGNAHRSDSGSARKAGNFGSRDIREYF